MPNVMLGTFQTFSLMLTLLLKGRVGYPIFHRRELRYSVPCPRSHSGDKAMLTSVSRDLTKQESNFLQAVEELVYSE